MPLEQPRERLQAIGNALGVVEAIDAEDDAFVVEAERACGRSLISVGALGGLRRARPQRRIDADRKRPHVGRPAAAPGGEVLVVDARLERAIDGVEEVVAVILDVKAQQIVAEQPVQDVLAPRADAERLAVRPRNVPELADRHVGPRLLDESRQQREVIVLHEHHRAIVADLFDHRIGEAAVDAARTAASRASSNSGRA